jgi:lipopolysaccharide heptosyltransferase II
MRLLPVTAPATDLSLPQLSPGAAHLDAARRQLTWDAAAPCIGLLPGAARGPSKRWPAERFAEVGRRLASERGLRIAVFGSAGEAAICREVADGIGGAAACLAGRTSLPELTALLAGCRAVVSNDSGGMHLAAAAGTPVVAIFGLTDPAVTGPIGAAHRVVAAAGVTRARAIPRHSEEAERALRSVTADEVFAAVVAALGRT